MKRHRTRAANSRRHKSKLRRKQLQRFSSRRLLGHVEQLEDRRVLEANPLASFEGTIEPQNSEDIVQLTLTGGDSSNIVALRTSATSGNLNPAKMDIQNGSTITPLVSLADVGTSTDSFMLVNLGQGSFDVTVSSEGGTGDFRLEAFLLGDLDDGIVSQLEMITADAAEFQLDGTGNYVAQLFYRQFGINLGLDHYDEAFDANMNGEVDSFDMKWIANNVDAPEVMIELIGEMDVPVITAELRNDTGRDDVPESFSDGLTNDATGDVIQGTLTDASQILSFMAAIDPANPNDISNYVDILSMLQDDPNVTPPNNGTAGLFSFTLAELDSILGSTVLNTGEHTLHLIAGDSADNEIDPSNAITIDFTIDTIAPDAPTTPDLKSDSDSGDSDTDDITNDATPTFTVDGETGSLVELSSDLSGGVIGSGVPSSPVEITSSDLADGTHNITARATDLAGNMSVDSAELQVTIDTQVLEVSLSLTEVFGLELSGPGQTPEDLADFAGTTEPGATVELSRVVDGNDAFVATADADASGKFAFRGIDLVLGDPPEDDTWGRATFKAEATDVAGNTLDVTEMFAQNNLPSLANGDPAPIEVNEDAASVEIDLTQIIEDVDIALGDTLSFTATSNDTTKATVNLVDNGTLGFESDTLIVSFVADANGNTSIDLVAKDELGLELAITIDVMILEVNDSPEFGLGVDFGILEDAGPQTVSGFATNISTGPANESGQTPTFLVTIAPGSDDLFVGDVEIDEATGDLTYTPKADANGSATILVQLMDDGGTANGGVDLSAVQMFDITINPVNDAPTFAIAGDQEAEEDSGAHTVTGFASNMMAGPTDEMGQSLTFSVSTDNDSAFAMLPAIDNTTGDLTYTLAADAFGEVIVTVTLSDDGGTANGGVDSSSQTFTLDITPLNDPPTANDDALDALVSQPTTLDVVGNDSSLPDGDEVLTIVPGSLSAMANDTGTLEIVDNKIVFTPNANAIVGETDTFTYKIVDDGNPNPAIESELATVTLTFVTNSVIAMDDEIPIPENTAGRDLDVLANDSDPQMDNFTIVSFDDSGLLGLLEIVPGGLSLQYTPIVQFSGSETFTYTIRDDQNPAAEDTATVTIIIPNINDAPVFTLPDDPDQELFEGTNDLQTISGFATDISPGGFGDTEAGQVLTFNITTNNDSLFSQLPAIDPATGDLTYQIAGEETVGSATVTVVLMDDGGLEMSGSDTSAPQMFDINVLGVNDAPSFVVGSDQTIGENSGPQTETGFATSISKGGGPDEAAQTLSFDITTNNDSLFSVLPVIDPSTGDLTYTPAANASGTATVTVQLMDNGGTDNGGVDTSASQMFDIMIIDTNNAPLVDNPLADISRNDFDSPAPETFDLSSVFSDPDGDNLSFMATSSNEELVTVQIINGDQLELTYLSYFALQDRTPSVITVTATDDGDGTLATNDMFTATVTPETTVDIQLTVLSAATALDNDGGLSRTMPPTSLQEVVVGESYVVEIWVTDLLSDGTIAGTASRELTGGTFDLNFDQLLGQATALTNGNHVGNFSTLPKGVANNTDGVVEGFGGGSLDSPGTAVAPNFSRLGFIEFTATGAGMQTFSLDLDSSDRVANPTDNPARVSIEQDATPSPANGSIHTSQVNLGSVTVNQIQTMSFAIDAGLSELTLGGTLDGQTLEDQQVGVSNTPQAMGTLDVGVDDLSNPTMLRISDSALEWENTGSWSPAVGGAAGSAPGILGFEDPDFMIFSSTNALLLAMRNLNSSILTDGSVALNGSGQFSADDWQGLINSADIDGSVGGTPATQQLTNTMLVNNGAAAASLSSVGNLHTLTLPINHTLTATTFFGLELNLNLTGQIVASFTENGSASAAASSGAASEEAMILAAFDEALADWDESVL